MIDIFELHKSLEKELGKCILKFVVGEGYGKEINDNFYIPKDGDMEIEIFINNIVLSCVILHRDESDTIESITKMFKKQWDELMKEK